MSGECEEVDKWLRPQILINLFEVRSPQATNLLKSGAPKQGNCQTNDHARRGQKKTLLFDTYTYAIGNY